MIRREKGRTNSGKVVTKQEILNAIQKCAEELERAPTHKELMKRLDVSKWTVRMLFGSYTKALKECKLEGKYSGRKVEMARLFRDWAIVARELKRIPSSCEYAFHGKYSEGPLRTRFGTWADVAPGLKRHVQRQGLEEEYKDVLAMIDRLEPDMAGKRGRAYGLGNPTGSADGTVKEGRTIEGRPLYGAPMKPCALAYCPTNEAGVIFLFGSMAVELGFMVTSLQAAFPDCEAMRRVEGGKCQPIQIEFEFQSRNFMKHMHDLKGCDLIICWEHNWPECPIEVLELRSLVGH
jgi:Homing endonuclease associated repeat